MTFTAAEHAAMRRALALAATPGVPHGPNPRVGCVLLDPSGAEVGEGFHRGAGTPHAEVDALAAAGDAARGATAVVTLEPCDHTGRTGPCTEALLAAGVVRVVFAQSDTNPAARGGAATLRDAGVDVEGGLLEEEARRLNRAWTFGHEHGRPFVTWKFATTLDGRSAAADGSSRWISSRAARLDTHRLRGECDVILVGTGTVAVDDPQLTVRDEVDEPLPRQPLRVVMGERDLPTGSAGLRRRRRDAPAAHPGPPGRPLRARRPRPAARLPRGRTHPRRSVPGCRRGRRGRGVRRADAARRRPLRRGRPRHHHDRRRGPPARGRRPRAPGSCGSRRGPRGHQRTTDAQPSSGEDDLMFTGIVEELGTVVGIEDQGDAVRITIEAAAVLEGTSPGDSISVNGCCLTVVTLQDDAGERGWWTADVMQETLDKTSLRGATPGDRVNLERAVTLETRLGGHVVQGHVDGVGTIVRRTPSEHWEVLEVSLPNGLGRYLVDKGSITVDGVSLTVVEAGRRQLHRQPDPRDPRPARRSADEASATRSTSRPTSSPSTSSACSPGPPPRRTAHEDPTRPDRARHRRHRRRQGRRGRRRRGPRERGRPHLRRQPRPRRS